MEREPTCTSRQKSALPSLAGLPAVMARTDRSLASDLDGAMRLLNLAAGSAMCAAVTLASGCAPRFTVRYPVEALQPFRDPALSSLRVRIAPFRDARKTAPESAYIFSSGREVSVAGGSNLCVNGEESYAEPALVEQIAAAIVAHLGQMHTYASVAAGNRAAGEYQLTGTLRRFYGEQQTSTAAQVGAAFGLVGALATADAQTAGEVTIELTHLEIIAPNGQKVAQLPDVIEHYQGPLPADADCKAIFATMNEHLEVAVRQLAGGLADQLRQAVAPKEVVPNVIGSPPRATPQRDSDDETP